MQKRSINLVGDGVLDIPQAEIQITEFMTLRGTFLYTTEINV